MREAEILAALQKAIATAIGAEESELTPEKKIFHELGVDSVDGLDISYELEHATGLDVASLFEEKEPDPDLTIQGLIDLLKPKLR